ncbi:molybdate ABC transporter substrate-binding protein [Methylophaga sp. 42_25_T18]|nr:molybdate ABC transporter substrate-binding protein [Methylophaga sp. 42_25_T18]OUR89063.1 molybdate ABC transporter substrate-binding protein [Methylophaga sp. 42_8_T64]
MRFILVFILSCSFFPLHAEEIRLAAATNLRYVMPVLAQQFEQNTGHHLAVSYAASGTLTTQILHDAPFELFLSANPDYINRLVEAGKTDSKVINYAQAQLAVYAANHSKLELDKDLYALATAIDNGSLNKVVIANPKHAPYGHAAKSVLEKAGIWQAIQAHLLIAENASQAVQFTMSTSVDAGFVPYSHVIHAKLKSTGRFVKLDSMLPQQAVLIKGATEPASQFMSFLQTEAAASILIKHGFVVKDIE